MVGASTLNREDGTLAIRSANSGSARQRSTMKPSRSAVIT